MTRTVYVYCYNRGQFWDSRKKAIAFYQEALDSVDPMSNEALRYSNVLDGLLSGSSDVDDGFVRRK